MDIIIKQDSQDVKVLTDGKDITADLCMVDLTIKVKPGHPVTAYATCLPTESSVTLANQYFHVDFEHSLIDFLYTMATRMGLSLPMDEEVERQVQRYVTDLLS